MKKIALLFMILCAGQLYGMEPERGRYVGIEASRMLEASYMGELPEELQALIIIELTIGKDLDAIINGLKNASQTTLKTILKPVLSDPLKFRDLIQMFAEQFPYINTEEIAYKFKTPAAKNPFVDISKNYVNLSSNLLINISGGNIDEIEKAIKNGADINFSENNPFPEHSGLTPLLHALDKASDKFNDSIITAAWSKSKC